MGVLAFWPLALLVLVPVIILLYILKQETKPKEFSSSMLWQEVVRNMEATKPWEKLRKNILLFLQIITVLLFIIAMMQPWIKGIGGSDRQAVVVIDNSASMGTMYEDGKTRLEAAKEAACAYVNDLPSSAVVYVISGNRQAILELANSSDKIEARNKINSIRQTSLAGDMTVTLGLVESCINQAVSPEVVFFTDTAFDTGDISASIDSFYNESENASLDSVSYAHRDDKFQILAQVTNYSKEALTREINIYGVDERGKEELLDILTINVPANESESTYLEVEEQRVQGVAAIHAEINDKDALAGDNGAWCVLSERNEKNVLLYTDSNMFIEKAMANISGVKVIRTAEADVFGGSDYDLYIFDGKLPDKLPEKGNMLFINCDKTELFESKESVSGTRLILGENELTTYIGGTFIGVNSSYVYDVPNWAQDYLRAGNSADARPKAAGFYGVYNGQKVITMGFDLHQSDFGLQAEFPILISNMAEYMLEGSLVERNIYTAGESIMVHGSTKGSNIQVVSPDGSSTSLAASEASGTYMQVGIPGIYRVSQEVNQEKNSEVFAVRFPVETESDVESVENTIVTNSKVETANIKTGAINLTNYILVILLILMLLEWFVYVRLM